MSRKITIRMPKRRLAKWLKALRSGEYTQGTMALFNESDTSYCCLGVLQHCLAGGVEYHHSGQPEGVPSIEWLSDWGISFKEWNGTISDVPYLPELHANAARANDQLSSFAKIADAIEACAEGV